MTHTTTLLIATITLFLVACGSLEKKSALIGIGDEKEHVLKIMGPPADRQLKGSDLPGQIRSRVNDRLDRNQGGHGHAQETVYA